MTPLERVRNRIDALDQKILALLNARARLVIQAGHLKSALGGGNSGRRPGSVAFVPHRERQVLDRIQRLNSGPFPKEALIAVFREIMSASLALEGRPRIACVGSEASASQRAARIKFGSQCEYVGSRGVRGVFAEVEKGRADLGVVPMDKASAALFASSDLKICAEIVLPPASKAEHFVVIGRTLAQLSGHDKTALIVSGFKREAELRQAFKAVGSRPGKVTALRNGFLVEISGHQSQPKVASVLASLKQRAAALKVLGSYPLA